MLNKKLKIGTASKSAIASVIAAVLGLVGGLIIMLIVNPGNAFAGLSNLIQGGFKSGSRGIGNTLLLATPLLLTGLSVGFAFKSALFNIGASGQYLMGLFFSLSASYYLNANWVVCILAGMIGGMLWGLIPGIFKAVFNVNEVITSIMTNYIGMYLVDMLIINSDTLYDSEYGRTFPALENSTLPKFGMDILFPNSYADSGIIIAVVLAIVVYITMKHTRLGYEIKACGLNKDAAKYAGINQNAKIILTMAIAGGLAGIAGALQIQSGAGNYYAPVNALQTYGFTGIAVALLGTSNPIGIIFSSLFFAHLQQGGLSLQALSFSDEIVSVIMGTVIYFSAFALIFKGFISKHLDKKKLASVEKEEKS